jgi:hypothetical protein
MVKVGPRLARGATYIDVCPRESEFERIPEQVSDTPAASKDMDSIAAVPQGVGADSAVIAASA